MDYNLKISEGHTEYISRIKLYDRLYRYYTTHINACCFRNESPHYEIVFPSKYNLSHFIQTQKAKSLC